jgi:hypothetical protein
MTRHGATIITNTLPDGTTVHGYQATYGGILTEEQVEELDRLYPDGNMTGDQYEAVEAMARAEFCRYLKDSKSA